MFLFEFFRFVLFFLIELGVSCIHPVYFGLRPSVFFYFYFFEIYFTEKKKKLDMLMYVLSFSFIIPCIQSENPLFFGSSSFAL